MGQRSRGRTGRAGVPQGLRGTDGESRCPPGPSGDRRGEQVSPRAFGGWTGRAGVPRGLRGMDGESRCPPGPLGDGRGEQVSPRAFGRWTGTASVPQGLWGSHTHVLHQLRARRRRVLAPVSHLPSGSPSLQPPAPLLRQGPLTTHLSSLARGFHS